ncbi:MAG: invasion associated locus B family protein [Hyphomicrobiaceae bacterium]
MTDRFAARGARLAVAATVGLGLVLAGGGHALAQAKKGAEKAAAAPAKPQSAWVKLCEKAPINAIGADGKPARKETNICLTHHERLDGNLGVAIVSAAVQELEGQKDRQLKVMVPLGMYIPAGLRVAVLSADLWKKLDKNETIDAKALKPLKLAYTLCHPAGCTAEITIPDDFLAQMKKGAGMVVNAVNFNGQPVNLPVPLDGFNATLAGKPVDNKAYAQARGQLMAQIRQRQQEVIQEQQRKAMEAKGVPKPEPIKQK